MVLTIGGHGKRLLPALTELADKKHLWVNALRLEEAGQAIQSIDLSPWRTRQAISQSGADWRGPLMVRRS